MKFHKPCKCEERLFDTLVVFGTGLDKSQTKLIGQLSTLLQRHRSLLVPIALVTNQNLVDSFRSMLLDVLVPSLYV